MRRRQELARLRPRQQGLPRRLRSCVPSRAASLHRPRTRPRRWPLHQDAARYRSSRSAILDDWGPEPLDADQRRDLLEIVEDRYEARSIIITSHLPVDRWYEIIGTPTMAH